MAILDIFKKKKKREEVSKETKVVKEEKFEKTPGTEKIIRKKRRKYAQSYKILNTPHITEKATALAEKNQYTFKILPGSNKTEVKRAIEGLYNVDVLSVKVINIPPKKRRLGRSPGWRKGYKKAIVKIKEGQKIELLPR